MENDSIMGSFTKKGLAPLKYLIIGAASIWQKPLAPV